MFTKMKQRVLGVERVRFTNDQGELVESGKVYAESSYVNDSRKVGCIPSILSCDVDFIDEVRELHFPDEYELEVEIRSGAKNKAVMYVNSIAGVVPISKKPTSDKSKAAA
jgi:hypothetical protein